MVKLHSEFSNELVDASILKSSCDALKLLSQVPSTSSPEFKTASNKILVGDAVGAIVGAVGAGLPVVVVSVGSMVGDGVTGDGVTGAGVTGAGVTGAGVTGEGVVVSSSSSESESLESSSSSSSSESLSSSSPLSLSLSSSSS